VQSRGEAGRRDRACVYHKIDGPKNPSAVPIKTKYFSKKRWKMFTSVTQSSMKRRQKMIFLCISQISQRIVLNRDLQMDEEREIIQVREGTLTAQPFVGPCPAYEGHFFFLEILSARVVFFARGILTRVAFSK